MTRLIVGVLFYNAVMHLSPAGIALRTSWHSVARYVDGDSMRTPAIRRASSPVGSKEKLKTTTTSSAKKQHGVDGVFAAPLETQVFHQRREQER